jgi:serine/threonine-protein kinase RsbT
MSETLRTKIVTAVSELARNQFAYARGTGQITLRPLTLPRAGIEIDAKDEGPGIANLDEIMAGRYKSPRGMGVGLRGTKALMDEFTIMASVGAGTHVVARKYAA